VHEVRVRVLFEEEMEEAKDLFPLEAKLSKKGVKLSKAKEKNFERFPHLLIETSSPTLKLVGCYGSEAHAKRTRTELLKTMRGSILYVHAKSLSSVTKDVLLSNVRSDTKRKRTES